MPETKKPRKPRKDKGKKRGKRIKNPRLQTGSIDFRTIGTSATMGPNLTSLIGSMAALARPIVQPQYLQPQVSTELVNYAPRDLPKNTPPPQFRPDTEQAQEEEPQAAEEVRRAMGQRIGRLREEEAKLFLKGKVSEAKNMKLDDELRQKQMQLVEQDEAMDLKRKSFLVEQIWGQSASNVFARVQSEIQGKPISSTKVDEKIIEVGGTDNYRNYLIEQAGLNPALVDKKLVRAGERGRQRKEWFYNPQKADLQRAQEEKPAAAIEELEDWLSEEELMPPPPAKAVEPPTPVLTPVQEISIQSTPEILAAAAAELQAAQKPSLPVRKESKESRLKKRVTESKGFGANVELLMGKPKEQGSFL